MSLPLIFSRKIKIYIRLLVSLKPKESLERYIKSFFIKRMSAFRAYLIRHIAACTSRICPDLIRFKINIMAFRAQIMWRQRVHLCNSCHCGYERRAYRASGADKISVLHGLPDKLLGNYVHNRESVADNRIKLSLKP